MDIEATILYSAKDLKAELDKVRQTPIPLSTLYRHIKALGMVPGDSGYYTDKDLRILVELNNFLSGCQSIRKFKQFYLNKEQSNADSK